MSCKLNVSSAKDFKLFLLVLFMQLSDILDLKQVIAKTAPTLPIFIFGYALILNNSILNIIFLIVSILITAIYYFLEEDKTVRGMTLLYVEHKDSNKIAEDIGKTKLKPFLLKSVILLFTFLWRVFALIMVIVFMIKNPDIVFLILLIINSVGILYSLITIIFRSRVKQIVGLIKKK